jgi:hypothetical protein
MKWLFDFYGDQGMGVILHVKQGFDAVSVMGHYFKG